jgi:hypothetical protein
MRPYSLNTQRLVSRPRESASRKDPTSPSHVHCLPRLSRVLRGTPFAGVLFVESGLRPLKRIQRTSGPTIDSTERTNSDIVHLVLSEIEPLFALFAVETLSCRGRIGHLAVRRSRSIEARLTLRFPAPTPCCAWNNLQASNWDRVFDRISLEIYRNSLRHQAVQLCVRDQTSEAPLSGDQWLQNRLVPFLRTQSHARRLLENPVFPQCGN